MCLIIRGLLQNITFSVHSRLSGYLAKVDHRYDEEAKQVGWRQRLLKTDKKLLNIFFLQENLAFIKIYIEVMHKIFKYITFVFCFFTHIENKRAAQVGPRRLETTAIRHTKLSRVNDYMFRYHSVSHLFSIIFLCDINVLSSKIDMLHTGQKVFQCMFSMWE